MLYKFINFIFYINLLTNILHYCKVVIFIAKNKILEVHFIKSISFNIFFPQDLNKSAENISLEKPKPKLLDGEIIITEGNRVLYFPNVADKAKGLSGNLYVTNFRFIFDAHEDDNSNGVSV